jgi:hypothetical protein
MNRDQKLMALREYIKDRINDLVPKVRSESDTKIMFGMNDVYNEMWNQIDSLIDTDCIDHTRTLIYDKQWMKDSNGKWHRKLN